jgi:hypothetical protein
MEPLRPRRLGGPLVFGSLTSRFAALLAALLPLGGSKTPGDLSPVKGESGVSNPAASSVNSRILVFRGERLAAPPGVKVLSETALLVGAVTVEFPEDVTVEFNARGEAVFSLAKGVKPHSWVLKVGSKKLVASASARAVVPLLGVGEPRIEWSRFAFPVSAPTEFLHQVHDLKDPFDASPYR